ncbi:MAG: hypothetical protein CSB24_04655 [Deltaproteobacteria bacterium]|nr:MAG: hypothetical protein CSB24_04655 [Deltaproteobacteria bacterium]
MIPIVYRWDDNQAPVLSGTKGSLIALLKACLVDGYGDKLAAGWTMPYANADESIACFRNDHLEGNGIFLRVDETANANQAYLQCYETMTSHNDGHGKFFDADTTVNLYKSNQASAASRGWLIAATKKIIYLAIWYDTGEPLSGANTVQGTLSVFGDYTRWPGTTHLNTIASYSWGDWDHIQGLFPTYQFWGAGDGLIRTSRQMDGTLAPTNLIVGGTSGPCRGRSGRQNTYDFGVAYDGSYLMLLKPYIFQAGVNKNLGTLPGFYYHAHNCDDFTNLQELTHDGRTLTNLKFVHKNEKPIDRLNVNLFLELGVDWG